MSFDNNDSRGIEIIANGGKLVYAGPIRKGFWYYNIPTFILVLFIASFISSAYFSLPLFEEDKPEYLVTPFTLIVAIWTGINGRVRLCMPTFILGSLWGGASLVFDSISIDIATFIFSYCCAVTILVLIDLIKRR